MPQAFQESSDVLLLQRQLVDLKQKLKLEETLLEASKRIQAGMDRKQNAQQIGNSVAESEERIRFLKGQVAEIEQKLQQVDRDRQDLYTTIRQAASSESLAPTRKLKQVITISELEYWRAGSSLSAAKVEYKLRELGCRLKIQENILSGTERMLEAWETHGSSTGKEPTAALKKLLHSRDQAKQKVSLLSQALKKYTSLALSETIVSEATNAVGSSFTGKLLIKVSGLSHLNATSRGPYSLEFSIDQLSSFSRSESSSQSGTSLLLPLSITSLSNNHNSSDLSCYHELSCRLQQATEVQIFLRSGSAQVIHGTLFLKLSSLFPCGPEQEWKLSETLELEPVGAVNLQLFYQPSKQQQHHQQQQASNRIQRKPAFKRTQHQILGHQLVSTNFFQLLKCSYCQDLIINSSGYQCTLCKLVCHKKCYKNLFNKCLNWDGKDDSIQPDPAILSFASKFNIPHQQRLCSVAIPTWCAHCGHLLPLGRRVNFKCEECSAHWHDRCDASICKNHCGLNAKLIEGYLQSISTLLKTKEESTGIESQITSKVTQPSLPQQQEQEPFSPLRLTKSKLPAKLFIEDFTLLKCIGKGNFGKVMLAAHKDDPDAYFAIKMLKKYSIVENDEFASVRAEKQVLQLATEAGFPFLTQAHAFFQDDHRVYFVMEFVEGGDFMFHIQNRPFSLDDAKFYLAELVLALEFLHEKGIMYRDLKLDNVLLSRDGHVKLADYGLSRCDMGPDAQTRTFCGTPEFMAPEMLLDQPYGFGIDFWAFGVLVYQVLENRSPFYGNNEREIFQSILKGKYDFLPATDKPARSLISKLLTAKPGDRLCCWREVKRHQFFAGVDWEALKRLQVPAPFVPELTGPEDTGNFDEIFTSEEVILTPYPSFILARDGMSIEKALEVFETF